MSRIFELWLNVILPKAFATDRTSLRNSSFNLSSLFHLVEIRRRERDAILMEFMNDSRSRLAIE